MLISKANLNSVEMQLGNQMATMRVVGAMEKSSELMKVSRLFSHVHSCEFAAGKIVARVLKLMVSMRTAVNECACAWAATNTYIRTYTFSCHACLICQKNNL
jgi:hypothetical protein